MSRLCSPASDAPMPVRGPEGGAPARACRCDTRRPAPSNLRKLHNRAFRLLGFAGGLRRSQNRRPCHEPRGFASRFGLAGIPGRTACRSRCAAKPAKRFKLKSLSKSDSGTTGRACRTSCPSLSIPPPRIRPPCPASPPGSAGPRRQSPPTTVPCSLGGPPGTALKECHRPLGRSRRTGPDATAHQPDRQAPVRFGRPRSAGLSAHGLRAGCLTEAALRGVWLPEAMQQSQHRSVRQAASCYNDAERSRGKAVRLGV